MATAKDDRGSYTIELQQPGGSHDDEEDNIGLVSDEQQSKPWCPPGVVKYMSLFTLVVQNTALVLLLRYSRTVPGPRYLSTTAVACMEMCKLIVCVMVVFYENEFSPTQTARQILDETSRKPVELAKLAVPSLLYTIQNNLLYLALSNLDAVIYQVCYQMKILTTALFSVLMLSRHLSPLKWFALVLLTIGVAVVQTSNMPEDGNEEKGQNPVLGFGAVLAACVTSGFSGVWFEKVLKADVTSLWLRNIQMSCTSIPLSLVVVLVKDGEAVTANGFFHGYSPLVMSVIFFQAFGGLTVAVVVKYADSILKGFAASYSIVASLLLDMVFFDFHPAGQFLVGTVLVNLATYLFAKRETPHL